MTTPDAGPGADFERQIARLAAALPYPPTPRLTARPAQRPIQRPHQRLARAALMTFAALLLAILAGLNVPELRAALLTIFRLGAATVTLNQPVALDGLSDDDTPPPLDSLAGATTLREAEAVVGYRLRLPPGPPPDRVFVQNGEVVVLVWLGEGRIAQALYQFSEDGWRIRKQATALDQTTVAGRPALWIASPHPVTFVRDGEEVAALSYFVRGHVLIWEWDDGLTYRLETGQSLEAARALAEAVMADDE
jgi:hypothetical protein